MQEYCESIRAWVAPRDHLSYYIDMEYCDETLEYRIVRKWGAHQTGVELGVGSK
jgi:hypothetical protein